MPNERYARASYAQADWALIETWSKRGTHLIRGDLDFGVGVEAGGL
jgi:hypothetical protein